jgi:hypothetical protein
VYATETLPLLSTVTALIVGIPGTVLRLVSNMFTLIATVGVTPFSVNVSVSVPSVSWSAATVKDNVELAVKYPPIITKLPVKPAPLTSVLVIPAPDMV